MILPTDEECARVIKELDGEPNLSEWESTFVENNFGCLRFTDRQKSFLN